MTRTRSLPILSAFAPVSSLPPSPRKKLDIERCDCHCIRSSIPYSDESHSVSRAHIEPNTSDRSARLHLRHPVDNPPTAAGVHYYCALSSNQFKDEQLRFQAHNLGVSFLPCTSKP